MNENLILLLLVITPPLLARISWDYIRNHRSLVRQTPRKKLLIGNLLVFMFAAATAMLAGEIYFRFFVDTTDSFSTTKISERWFKRHYHRNLAGFRDSVNYLPEPAGDRLRITFIGDSFTAAQGIADVENRFANRIRSQHPEFEIHVLAECGWDTGRQLELLRFLPKSGYRADIVVLVYCMNDIADLIPEWRDQLAQIYDSNTGFPINSSYLLDTLYARIHMHRMMPGGDYFSVVNGAYSGQIWEDQKSRLSEVHMAATQAGSRLVVVTFPFMHALDNYAHESAHKQLSAFWGEVNVPHLDLLPVFASRYQLDPHESWTVNSRDAHPGEFAHSLAAEEIGKFLLSVVAEP